MSQSPHERSNRPPKRGQPLTDSSESLPAPQKLKDNNQNPIKLQSTESLVSEFLSKSSTSNHACFTAKRLYVPYNSGTKPSNQVFRKCLFPILSQNRHYRNTMQSIEIDFAFEPESIEELPFLANCIDQLSLLPRLKHLHLIFHKKRLATLMHRVRVANELSRLP